MGEIGVRFTGALNRHTLLLQHGDLVTRGRRLVTRRHVMGLFGLVVTWQTHRINAQGLYTSVQPRQNGTRAFARYASPYRNIEQHYGTHGPDSGEGTVVTVATVPTDAASITEGSPTS